MERQPAGAGPEPTGTEQHGEAALPQEALRRDQPRIYVASLSDYNAGVLHGTWIDAAQDLDTVYDSVNEMLRRSPTDRQAEELAVHDYEGFGALRLGEYDSLEWITTVARGITEHGRAFAAWASTCDGDQERLARFDEGYLGEWKSLAAYAEDLLDDLGVDEMIERSVPDSLQPYVSVNAEGFGRDLEMSGDITAIDSSDGGVWVFQTDV